MVFLQQLNLLNIVDKVDALTESLALDGRHCLVEDIRDGGFLKSAHVETMCRASICPSVSSAVQRRNAATEQQTVVVITITSDCLFLHLCSNQSNC